MKSLKIGGVPEHFNLPWHMLLESDDLERVGVKAEWRDFPEGTGAMIDALNNEEVDIAMLLTEGAIAGIDRGGQYKIISLYVSSPLIWGIHVPANSPYYDMEDVKGKRYAISRYGSGSHLMSYIDAQNRNWALENLRFEVVENLEGAREAFKNEKAEVFLWEKFTTKPYVDSGEFRRIAECPTPYPCFVVCANNNALTSKEDAIKKVSDLVLNYAAKLNAAENKAGLVAQRYGLKEEDIKAWFNITTWASHAYIDFEILNKVIETLSQLDLIEQKLGERDLIHTLHP